MDSGTDEQKCSLDQNNNPSRAIFYSENSSTVIHVELLVISAKDQIPIYLLCTVFDVFQVLESIFLLLAGAKGSFPPRSMAAIFG